MATSKGWIVIRCGVSKFKQGEASAHAGDETKQGEESNTQGWPRVVKVAFQQRDEPACGVRVQVK